ncbi:LON peptidase substrate-binding domain-containing protein [soil metagenome]
MANAPLGADLSAVPVFPLPSVVLLPGAVLPLHVFEERYIALTRAALESDRQIAMALLSPGWQQTYHGRAKIEPVVCIGTILSHEKLSDGKYNFLLQGHTRAQVKVELPAAELFRRLSLEAIAEVPAHESSLLGARQKFSQVFESGFLAGTKLGQSFAKLLNSQMPTADVADLIAFNCLDDLAVKQMLLGEPDVARRVETIAKFVASLQSPAVWPTNESYRNPSAN